MSDLRNKLIKLAYDNPNLREALKPLLSEMVEEARFEKGVPADPTENMSPEEAEKWEEMKEKYKDKFKEKESNTESNMSDLRNKLVKLAYNKPELREDLLPLLKIASVSHTDLEKKVKKLLPEAGIEATKMRWLKKGDSAEMTHTGEEARVWALKIKTYQNTEFVLRFEVPDRYERVKHVAVNTGRYDVASVPGVDWERELVLELDDLRQTMMI